MTVGVINEAANVIAHVQVGKYIFISVSVLGQLSVRVLKSL